MAKGKVLFIIHDVYQENNNFPLGAGYMAAMLRKYGAEVEIYCMDVFHYTNDELANHLDKNEYDLIGVGFMAARFKETIQPLCKVINKHKKEAWLVLGGQGPSPIPRYMLRTTGTDVVAIGEAEETIVDLMKCKIERGDLADVPGIAFMKEGESIVNKRRLPFKDLDSLPFPLWEIFPMEEYAKPSKPFEVKEKVKSLAVISSRGCVNTCNFCYRMEKGIRFRSVPNLMAELKILNRNYGISFFKFMDELFTFSRKRVFDFCEAVKKERLQIKFFCDARVDIFDEELILALKGAGCHFIVFGMESTSQKVLDLMKKNTKVEDNFRVADLCKKLGVNAGLNFLWGNIGDDEQTLKDNVAAIKRYNTYSQIRSIRPVTPYPGSELYYEAIRRGLLEGPDDFFDRFKNSDLILCNFMEIPIEQAHGFLFEANKDLVLDHFTHTNGDMKQAAEIIEGYRKLYFEHDYSFRGPRAKSSVTKLDPTIKK